MLRFVPLVGLVFLSACRNQIAFDTASMPVPPHEHPRLYLRARDIPDLRRRTEHPVLKTIWDNLQERAKTDRSTAMEVDSVRYLLTGDDLLARRTAAAALRLLQESTFDMKQQDVSRQIG